MKITIFPAINNIFKSVIMKEGRKIYLFFVMKILFPLTPFTLAIFNDLRCSYGYFYIILRDFWRHHRPRVIDKTRKPPAKKDIQLNNKLKEGKP